LAGKLHGLEPDERVLASAAASFRGATSASIRATFALGSARRRLDAYYVWREQAQMAGLTTAGPEMLLGVTDTRLVVWSTTFWLSRPHQVTGTIALTKVSDVATVRHGLVTSLALALTTGDIVEVEAMRGRRLARVADALREVIATTRRPTGPP